MDTATISIVTPKGESISKTFPVCNKEDIGYLAGYMQACKDKGAIVKVVSTCQD